MPFFHNRYNSLCDIQEEGLHFRRGFSTLLTKSPASCATTMMSPIFAHICTCTHFFSLKNNLRILFSFWQLKKNLSWKKTRTDRMHFFSLLNVRSANAWYFSVFNSDICIYKYRDRMFLFPDFEFFSPNIWLFFINEFKTWKQNLRLINFKLFFSKQTWLSLIFSSMIEILHTAAINIQSSLSFLELYIDKNNSESKEILFNLYFLKRIKFYLN